MFMLTAMEKTNCLWRGFWVVTMDSPYNFNFCEELFDLMYKAIQYITRPCSNTVQSYTSYCLMFVVIIVETMWNDAALYMTTALNFIKGIKTGSGGVCCHNARGRMRNRKSNPEGVSPRDLTYCSHKPECIVTTNLDRSVLIRIITWHLQFRPVNVSILHLKDDYRARSEGRFACYSHCYVTWCPLMTGIVASQCPSAWDAVLVTRYLMHFISACLNSFVRFLPK